MIVHSRNPFLSFAAVLLLMATAVVAAEDDEWPREIETAKGLVVLYQPQLDSLEGNALSARAAVSVTPEGADIPYFGAAWLEARIATDLDTRMVTLNDVGVPRVRFTDATDEQQQELAALLTAEIPTWNIEMSLDRLSAMLEVAEAQSLAAEGFDDTPPKILFTDEPAVLISIDGEPQLRELEDSKLQHVVNSPFLIVQDPKNKNRYYLYAGSESWYSAPAVKGPWQQVTKKVPKEIRQLEPEDEEVDPEEAAEGPDTPPAIVVATEPTELIVTDGQPQFLPVGDGDLLIISNTESDVLRENTTQRIFVLLSGRWFASRSVTGPWEFVPSDELPESFKTIDPDSDYGHLLAWVAGTEMAEETVLDSYLPQTAAVNRDATIEVEYDGEPQFEPIEETSLSYALNTPSQVILAEGRYYCAEQGVWYVADDPKGPWKVATEVPDEIYTIPASNPNHNVTYVYVYDSTPEVVHVGYYPGYTNSYHYHGCLVYGTGWYYRPWWGHRYYPRYRTWGFHVRWNPWYGWSFGFSFSTGRFTFSIGRGGWYRRGWWGPGGWRGYRRGYNRGWHRGYRQGRRAGYRAGYRAAQRDTARNLYQRGDNASRVAKASGAQGARSPGASTGRANNVFADKNGNVYRRQDDGGWQRREGGQWNNADVGQEARSRADTAAGQRAGGEGQRPSGATTGQRPSGGDTAQRPSGAGTQRPSGQQPSVGSTQRSRPPSAGGSSSLNNNHQSRQRGAQRSRSAPRGGARRGGGGRR